MRGVKLKVGIMQPYFFPYIAYWQLINHVDRYVVFDDVAYIKGGWINRNRILQNNRIQMITIPLDHSSSFKMINEIYVTSNYKARKKIIRCIEYSYKKSSFFSDVMSIIEKIIMESKTIAEMNYRAILMINDYIGIETEIILSSSMKKEEGLLGEDRVIHICKKLNGDEYINALGGKSLYSLNRFRENGIELSFLKRGDIEYNQNGDAFVSDLSIIDILMNCEKDSIKNMLNKYVLE